MPSQPVTLEKFVGVLQAQDEWCWAAASASVYNYFAAIAVPARDSLSQCSFVTYQFPAIGGCTQGSIPKTCIRSHCFNPEGNRPSHLNWQLQRYDLLLASINCNGTDQVYGDKVSHGGFDALEVKAQIDMGCPVALRVLLRIENGVPISHFLVITGYDPESLERVVIWDPNLGTRNLTLEELLSLYGPLEQKYLTRQAPTWSV